MRRFIGKGEREKTIKYRFFRCEGAKARSTRSESTERHRATMRREWAVYRFKSLLLRKKQDIPNGMPCFFTVEEFKLSMRRYIGRGERRSKAPYLKSISRPEAEKNIEAEQSSVVQINLPL